MAKLFLGIGTAFPVTLQNGVLVRAAYEESVRQSILIILGTAKGERIMRPDFGCGIHDLVFASASRATVGRVQQEVNQALLRLEPRINVIEVSARVGREGNALLIDIKYEVRATNNVFNLVYPFYLQGAAA
jgi:hypothetical protein